MLYNECCYYFQDLASQEFRMQEVNEQADKLVNEGHPEKETIVKRKEVTLYSFFKYLFFPYLK